MGVFYVTAELAHATEAGRRESVRFLVDTGAFYSMVPEDILKRLQIRPLWRERVQFADGRKARWRVGEARLFLEDRTVTTLVFFGRRGTQALLGAYSLEGLRLTVDPGRRRLVPMPFVIVAQGSPLAAFEAHPPP